MDKLYTIINYLESILKRKTKTKTHEDRENNGEVVLKIFLDNIHKIIHYYTPPPSTVQCHIHVLLKSLLKNPMEKTS